MTSGFKRVPNDGAVLENFPVDEKLLVVASDEEDHRCPDR